MTVTYTGVSQNLTASKVLFYNDDTIKALAQAAMINMAEANIEMICDLPEEYQTKADVERVFDGLNEQAADMIRDVMDDFRDRLLAELATKKYTACVKAMRFCDVDGGLDDVDVKLTFE
jgi:Zn-dependent M32 family carboxypeptidase